MSSQQDGEELKLKFGVCELQGKRPYMEDRCLMEEDLFALGETENPFSQGGAPIASKKNGYFRASLFGVFDGHGGSITSSFLKEHFALALASSANFPASPRRAFEEAAQLLDSRLSSAYGREVLTDGSTGVVALLLNTDLWVCNVGDSRAVLARRGAAFPLSTDHKPEMESERRRIEGLGGVVKRGMFLSCELGPYRVYSGNGVAGGLAVSRAFGDFFYKTSPDASQHLVSAIPEVTHTTLVPGDDAFMLIASDGFWDVYSSEEAVKEAGTLLDQGALPNSIVKILAIRAIERRSMDNVSIILVDFRGSQLLRAF